MENKQENKIEKEKPVEKTIEKKEEKKEEKKIVKKDEAIVNGRDLPVSTKFSVGICNFIRGKKIEKAIEDLEKVVIKKVAVPMKGENPHKKNAHGGGRYPIKGADIFIKLLKSLNANSNVNGIENPIIFTAKADVASKPFKRGGGRRFKRTNVYLVSRKGKIENKEGKNKN